jgi:hypothetical protein
MGSPTLLEDAIVAALWPDAATGTVCQECWEAQSSRPWWTMVQLLPEEGEHA